MFLLGSLVGFGFGYIVKSLRTIEETVTKEAEELDVLVAIARKNHPKDFEAGISTWEFIQRVALLIVVLVVAWSAIATANTNEDVKKQADAVSVTQKQQAELQAFVARISTCNQQYLAATIRALNQRQESVQSRADANLALQKEQAAFFSLLLGQPPKSEAVRRNAAEKYLNALTHFVEQSNRTERQNASFPYPTNEGLTDCINERKTP